MSLSPSQKLAAAMARVYDERSGIAPYFGAVLRGLVRRESTDIPTLAVSERGILYWNASFVDKHTVEVLAFGLVHETMHVTLKHFERAAAAGVVLGPTMSSEMAHKAELANIAEDACINESLLPMAAQAHVTLPAALTWGQLFGHEKGGDGWVYPETLKQPAGLIFEDRFRRLLDMRSGRVKQGQGQGQQGQGQQDQGQGQQGQRQGQGQQGQRQGQGQQGQRQGQGQQGQRQGQGQQGQGQGQGGGAGKPGQGQGQGRGQGQGQGQPGVGAGGCGSCTGHRAPGEPGDEADGRSAAEMERFRRDVAAEVQKHVAQHGRGVVPGDLIRWAEEYFEPPKVDWREKLANTMRDAIDTRPGATDMNWRGISRRQSGLGFGTGRPIVPAFHAPVPHVGIIFDTSGSMGDAELSAGAREINGVLQEIHADVTLAVCDAQLHGIAEVDNIEQAVGMLKGGGGTDMRPAFDALEARDPQPEVVVVLTDGCLGDGLPDVEPDWCRVVFVLLGPYQMKPCGWGSQIFVDEVGAHEA